MAHRDDPHGSGYHGSTYEDRVAEEADRLGVERLRENTSAVTHPSNAAPGDFHPDDPHSIGFMSGVPDDWKPAAATTHEGEPVATGEAA
jgi:hypothetical protein